MTLGGYGRRAEELGGPGVGVGREDEHNKLYESF